MGFTHNEHLILAFGGIIYKTKKLKPTNCTYVLVLDLFVGQ